MNVRLQIGFFLSSWKSYSAFRLSQSAQTHLQAKTGSSFFATSRPILGIPEEFERRGSSILEIRASDEDMRKYLDGHINQISAFVREAPGIEDKIKSAIIKAADGM